MPLIVNFNGISMGVGQKDAFGVEWHVGELQGWDSPEVRQSLSDPVGTAGVVLTESRYAGRPLSLRGHLYVYNEAAQHEARRRLVLAADCVTQDATLTVTGEAVAKQLTVRRSGRMNTKILSPYVVEFEIPLIAVDPRKYSIAPNTQNLFIAGSSNTITATVQNHGDFETFATLTIAGASNVPTIRNATDGNKTLSLTGTNGVSDTIVVDMQARTVLYNTNDFYSWVAPTARWWKLLPGNNSITYSRTTSYPTGSTLTVAWRDAWL